MLPCCFHTRHCFASILCSTAVRWTENLNLLVFVAGAREKIHAGAPSTAVRGVTVSQAFGHSLAGQ